VADIYDRVRPGYPDEAVDALVDLSRLPAKGRLVEIGAGTGQLTVALAERGYSIVAVEMGPALAERCEANLSDYRDAHVVAGRFEEIDLPPDSFDLVVAATSFHWLDPAVAYRRAAEVLRPHGSLGLLWNLHVDADVGFFAESEEIYERLAPQVLGPGISGRMANREARVREIEATGLFVDVASRAFPWSAEYDRETYLDLLSTYADHIALQPDVRAQLDVELGALIDKRYGGVVEKHYQTVLYVGELAASTDRAVGDTQ
jgi:SAM-dependent methyltransferase